MFDMLAQSRCFVARFMKDVFWGIVVERSRANDQVFFANRSPHSVLSGPKKPPLRSVSLTC